MKRSTKLYERRYIKVRDKIERKGIVLANNMVKAHYQSYLDTLKTVGLNQYNQIHIPEQITKKFFYTFYPMASIIGVMEYEHLESQAGIKAEQTDKQKLLNSIFQTRLTEIVNTTAGKKITTITATSEETIKKIIRVVLDVGDTEGWGIDKITSSIYKEVSANLRGNGYARARAIAQTEIISASNQASTAAAELITSANGLKYRKFWSTSGLPNIRETHIEAEQYSDDRDGLEPDEVFPNGLQYPGDPNGAVDEVINCRCTIMHEIVL